jgi:hypothetical protein
VLCLVEPRAVYITPRFCESSSLHLALLDSKNQQGPIHGTERLFSTIMEVRLDVSIHLQSQQEEHDVKKLVGREQV